jgi:NAD(P)H dehydrogenase (quinone)
MLGAITNGDGSRDVSEKEKEIARNQGENFGKIVSTYVAGKNATV